MADRKIIAVVGATGAQGGGLARAILADPGGGFAARALTRKPDSDEARRSSRARGAEVVACDTRRRRSPSGRRSRARTARTASRSSGSTSRRRRRWRRRGRWPPPRRRAGVAARHLVHARRHAQVGAALRRPDADADGASTRCRTSTRRARPTTPSPTAGVPTTFLLTSFYWDNFIDFGMGPKKGPDGRLALTLPMGDKKLPGIAVEDIGRCAYGIFKQGRRVRRQDRRHRGRAPDRRADGGGARRRRSASEVRLQRGDARGRTAASASRAPRTSATCSSSSATSRTTTAARAASPSRGR